MANLDYYEDLSLIYRERFQRNLSYRRIVWQTLAAGFFQRLVRPEDTVLDLGCGYGEFINSIRCRKKMGMDMNPDSPQHLAPEVIFVRQDCSETWQIPEQSLDVVFTSNFFEHLPSKLHLHQTLCEAMRCLRPGGALIALGPNIKFTFGRYWDFWDHHIMLTDMSLSEAMHTCGFLIEKQLSRFLPYTMVNSPHYPPWLLRIYLSVPVLWKLFGAQFLVVARKPDHPSEAATKS